MPGRLGGLVPAAQGAGGRGAAHGRVGRGRRTACRRWLKEYDLVMLRGHGPFAIGHLLEEAYQLTSVLEMACRILTISEGMGAEVKEYRKGSDKYGSW